MNNEQRKLLSEILNSHFDIEELDDLLFNFDLKYEDFPGAGKKKKINEIIRYFERHERIPELVQIVKELRPNLIISVDSSVNPGLFRGMKLEHGIDPLRSALKVMEPNLFEEICQSILHKFRFEIATREPLTKSELSVSSNLGRGIIFKGVFFDTFTYTQQLLTEFGYGKNPKVSELLGKEIYYNDGGHVEEVHGLACILIWSKIDSNPEEIDILTFGEVLKKDQIPNVISFINDSVYQTGFLGILGHTLSNIGLNSIVLHVEDISYQILVTDIYKQYQQRLSWAYQNRL